MDVLNGTRRSLALGVGLFVLAGGPGCSAVYDFGSFRVGDAGASMDAMDGAADDAALDAALDAGPATDGGLTRETFVDQFVTAACAKATRCEGKLGALAILQMVCHPGLRDRLIEFVGFNDPGTTLDLTAAQACLDIMTGPDCSFGGSFDACSALFVGPVSDGAACHERALANDCMSGACEGGACPRCAPRGELGATCDGATDPPCRNGLNCHGGVCSGFLGLGDECGGNGCGADLFCDGSPVSTCRPLPNVGQACHLAFLAIDPCRGSLVCHNDVCVDGGAVGATCGGATDLPCRPGLRCGPLGACVAISDAGGACLSRANCPVAFECVGEVCVPLPTLGQACTPTLPCVEGGCTAGHCVALPDGASCPVPIEPFWDRIAANLGVEFQCANRCDGTTCVPFRTDGMACTASLECRDGASCEAPATPGVCTACPP